MAEQAGQTDRAARLLLDMGRQALQRGALDTAEAALDLRPAPLVGAGLDRGRLQAHAAGLQESRGVTQVTAVGVQRGRHRAARGQRRQCARQPAVGMSKEAVTILRGAEVLCALSCVDLVTVFEEPTVDGLLRDTRPSSTTSAAQRSTHFFARRVVGVTAQGPEGKVEVRAHLTVACDGRHSDVRRLLGKRSRPFGAPMDVLWFRLSKRPTDDQQALGRIQAGVVFVTLDRGDYWQCAYVIPKGGFEELRRKGLEVFRDAVARLNPRFAGRVTEIASWDDVKLLTVTVDRLKRWCRPGLLCIGDAAHAMSPIGGVGINLAIQDAVAAANVLFRPLREGGLSIGHLRRIQKKRELPTRVTQWLQVTIQRRVIAPVLEDVRPSRMPLALRLLAAMPVLRRIPGRVIGIGIRPEHVSREIMEENAKVKQPI